MQQSSGRSNKVMLKIDFANAFNEVDRDIALAQVRQHFPGLARWTQ